MSPQDLVNSTPEVNSSPEVTGAPEAGGAPPGKDAPEHWTAYFSRPIIFIILTLVGIRVTLRVYDPRPRWTSFDRRTFRASWWA